MSVNMIHAAQNAGPDTGRLKVSVTSSLGLIPVTDARVKIAYKGMPDSTIEILNTDMSGQTEEISLPAPPLEYSLEPGSEQPYSEYNIEVDAPGYEPVTISGTEVLPNSLALQPVQMNPMEVEQREEETIVIPDHTLYGEYPPKIPEDEIKPMDETGEIVLSRVVIPEYVVVHDGVPSDASAPNYYVKYKDYIKNVASSEIYATWPESSIYANVLAIMSVTLNRVYTEWYRNRRWPQGGICRAAAGNIQYVTVQPCMFLLPVPASGLRFACLFFCKILDGMFLNKRGKTAVASG